MREVLLENNNVWGVSNRNVAKVYLFLDTAAFNWTVAWIVVRCEWLFGANRSSAAPAKEVCMQWKCVSGPVLSTDGFTFSTGLCTRWVQASWMEAAGSRASCFRKKKKNDSSTDRTWTLHSYAAFGAIFQIWKEPKFVKFIAEQYIHILNIEYRALSSNFVFSRSTRY